MARETQAAELDLDFHIEFPSPDEDYSNIYSTENGTEGKPKRQKLWPNGTEKLDSSDGGETKEILVILLGWAGAQDKYLAKYSDFYLSQGCVVLRYISPIRVLFVDTGKLPLLAARLVRLLKDLQLESNPLFFHVFSNGGGFMYSYILRELAAEGDECKFAIRGTIFDSTPSPRNFHTCFKALANIFSGFSGLRWLIAAGIVMLLILQVFWYHLKSAVSFCMVGDHLEPADGSAAVEDAPLQNWLNRISRMRNHSCLFIYSEADELIPWKQVEHFSNILSSRGNRVQRLKFIDSPHVQHYRKYPEEYTTAVTKFIQETMQENKGPAILWKEC